MQQEIQAPTELPPGALLPARTHTPARSRGRLEVRRLTGADEPRVLDFLRREPFLNFQMIGLIREHGLESRRNRGTFYGCTRGGRLAGVALLGEWVSAAGARETLPLFARVARTFHAAHMRMALLTSVEAGLFDRAFSARGGRPADAATRHTLFVKDRERDAAPAFARLRLAEPFEIDQVVRAHVRAAVETNGADPSAHDPERFRRRLLARVEAGRVWVVCDKAGRVIFKTDVAIETDEVAYLEAVWTSPQARGRGLGGRALGDLTRRLLGCYRAVCLFAASDKPHLTRFYQRLGFRAAGPYRLLRYKSSC